MKKNNLILLTVLLSIVMFGCTENAQTKERPHTFSDAQSVQAYLEDQNQAYVETEKTPETFQRINGWIQRKTVSTLMP